jgi:hypothetical protein
MKAKSPRQRLDGFIDKYVPEVAAFARAVLDKMRARLPGAVEFVYDNYNWLVIGFGPTERPSDAVFSVVLPPGRVTLCFLQGARLPDPHHILRGNGKVVRNLGLESPDDLDRPEVQDLIAVALERARVPFDPEDDRQLIIKSVSAKQRLRRPAK